NKQTNKQTNSSGRYKGFDHRAPSHLSWRRHSQCIMEVCVCVCVGVCVAYVCVCVCVCACVCVCGACEVFAGTMDLQVTRNTLLFDLNVSSENDKIMISRQHQH